MNELKNRQSTNSNQKKLSIIHQEHNEDGSIKELIVDIERNDLDIIEEGTKLDANILTTAISSIATNIASDISVNNINNVKTNELEDIIIDTIYKKIYQIDIPPQLSMLDVAFPYSNNYYIIPLLGNRLYAKVTEKHSSLDISINNQNDKITILTTVMLAYSFTNTVELDYYLDIFANSACTYFITRLKGTVRYTPESIGPGD